MKITVVEKIDGVEVFDTIIADVNSHSDLAIGVEEAGYSVEDVLSFTYAV